MTLKENATAWKDVVQITGIAVAITLSVFNFWQANIHFNDDLQATFTGPIDYADDRVGDRFAVVNTGTRQAVILEAQLLIWNDHNTNHGPGFHWDPIPVRPGESFPATVVKPGEIAVVALPTAGHNHDYFSKPIDAIRLDEKYKQVVLGIRLHSMDSRGIVYTIVYPYAHFKVAIDYERGPTEGFYIDYRPHQLFVNDEQGPKKS